MLLEPILFEVRSKEMDTSTCDFYSLYRYYRDNKWQYISLVLIFLGFLTLMV